MIPAARRQCQSNQGKDTGRQSAALDEAATTASNLSISARNGKVRSAAPVTLEESR